MQPASPKNAARTGGRSSANQAVNNAQIARLKDQNAALRQRITSRDATIASLSDFKNQAIARLAAQHDEITRLRQDVRLAAGVRRLPVPPAQQQNPS